MSRKRCKLAKQRHFSTHSRSSDSLDRALPQNSLNSTGPSSNNNRLIMKETRVYLTNPQKHRECGVLRIGPPANRTTLRTPSLQANYTEGSHSRTDTTIVKEISQSYQFISALSCEKDSLVDSSDTEPQNWGESPFTRQRHVSALSKEELTETQLPPKLFCPSCSEYVFSTVCYQPAETGFWRKLLCRDCANGGSTCIALYCCRRCSLVLTKMLHNS